MCRVREEGKALTTHWWARCEHPSLCGWGSKCYTSRGAAAAAAGQHKRKHEREGMAPGVRASTRILSHDVPTTRAAGCLGEPVSA